MVVSQLRQLGAVAFVVDAGAQALRGRAFAALARQGLDARAVLHGQTGAGSKGLSDVVGVAPDGRAIFVEVKAPAWYEPGVRQLRLRRCAGQPSEAQLAFLLAVWRSGAVAGVAWSPRDLLRIWPVNERGGRR